MANKRIDQPTGTETVGHEWDGIEELNTPLPRWWLWTFYATIAFALVWVVIYPALPIPGATGTSGWIAREAVVRDVQQAEARMAPMMSRLRAATIAPPRRSCANTWQATRCPKSVWATGGP